MIVAATAVMSCASKPSRGGGASAGSRPTSSTGATPGGSHDPSEPPREVATGAMGSLTATKWRLPNGLEVILMPDGNATSISYMTWFRVGSRHENEAAGETGLAHLFEHLMFTQTKGAKTSGEFDRRMEEVGASVNAMTYYDFTAYVDDLPPSELELAVRLEADRMVNLELRQNQVENERDVVAEERLSSVEDSVDGMLDEILYKQAFKTHPYRWPVIGWMKDIKAVTDQKALAFYSTFYAPNNAVVVMAGKLDPKHALDLVVRHYGPLPPSPRVPTEATKPERAPGAEIRASIVRPVPADRLVVGTPGVALGDADRAAHDMMNEVLLGGPSSRLYRLLVIEKEIASSASGDSAPTKDPGLYAIWVQMKKDHTASEAEAVITAELTRLAQEPVPDSELAKARNRLETAFWTRLSTSHGKSELLGHFDVSAGDFRKVFARAAEYASVSAADVKRVAAAAFGRGHKSVVVATPKEKP